MKSLILKILKFMGLAILGIVLILVIWQPVLPSGIIIKQMAGMIEPGNITWDQPKVVRFELSGRGGGIFNIVADNTNVEMVEGDLDQADLILFMAATDFNDLMLLMARGKVDESVFMGLTISNVLQIAGDINLMEQLFAPPETS